METKETVVCRNKIALQCVVKKRLPTHLIGGELIHKYEVAVPKEGVMTGDPQSQNVFILAVNENVMPAGMAVRIEEALDTEGFFPVFVDGTIRAHSRHQIHQPQIYIYAKIIEERVAALMEFMNTAYLKAYVTTTPVKKARGLLPHQEAFEFKITVDLRVKKHVIPCLIVPEYANVDLSNLSTNAFVEILGSLHYREISQLAGQPKLCVDVLVSKVTPLPRPLSAGENNPETAQFLRAIQKENGIMEG